MAREPSERLACAEIHRVAGHMDGNNVYGRLDAGLLFISYQRSFRQFVDVRRSPAADRLNEYIWHVGSVTFIVPPGASEGGSVGETLFG